jgi:hypothetical protein
MVTEDQRVRYFYRGDLDASEAPDRSHSSAPTVVILRPGDEGPGAITTTLVDLERAYASAGVRVHVLDSARLTRVAAELARHSPDILHVAAGLVDDVVGVAIDLAGGVAGEVELPQIERERMTTTGLALTLAAVAPPGPVIVLDPPAVSHVAVHASQLLLRNAFAAEITLTTRVPAVIGTGLVRYGAQDALYRQLPSALASSQSVAAVVADIRRLEKDHATPDGLGFPAAALFAARPGHATLRIPP